MLEDIMDAIEEYISKRAVSRTNYQDAFNAVTEAEENLEKHLNNEDQKALANLLDLTGIEAGELAIGYFNEGFRLGTEIALRLYRDKR